MFKWLALPSLPVVLFPRLSLYLEAPSEGQDSKRADAGLPSHGPIGSLALLVSQHTLPRAWHRRDNRESPTPLGPGM